MTIDATPSGAIPAGWYTDPANPAGFRWWDGAAWTHSVREDAVAPAQPVAPTVAHTAVAPITVVPLAAPIASAPVQAPLRGNFGGFAAASSLPVFEAGRYDARAPIVRSITHTRAASWISGQPLWSVVPQLIVVAILGLGNTQAIVIGLALANLLCLGVLLALAFSDRAALLAGGNGSAASAWWMLLTPLAYLIARTIEVRRWADGGWALVVWWVIATVLVPAATAIGVFAFYGLMPI
jgi:hypothetical protein